MIPSNFQLHEWLHLYLRTGGSKKRVLRSAGRSTEALFQKFILAIITLPETNIVPKDWWLGDYIPFGRAHFQGRTVSFREGTNTSSIDGLKAKNETCQHLTQRNLLKHVAHVSAPPCFYYHIPWNNYINHSHLIIQNRKNTIIGYVHKMYIYTVYGHIRLYMFLSPPTPGPLVQHGSSSTTQQPTLAIHLLSRVDVPPTSCGYLPWSLVGRCWCPVTKIYIQLIEKYNMAQSLTLVYMLILVGHCILTYLRGIGMQCFFTWDGNKMRWYMMAISEMAPCCQ